MRRFRSTGAEGPTRVSHWVDRPHQVPHDAHHADDRDLLSDSEGDRWVGEPDAIVSGDGSNAKLPVPFAASSIRANRPGDVTPSNSGVGLRFPSP